MFPPFRFRAIPPRIVALVTVSLTLLLVIGIAGLAGAQRADAQTNVANSEVEYLGADGWKSIGPDGEVSWDVSGGLGDFYPGGPGLTAKLTLRGTSGSKQHGEVISIIDDLGLLTATTRNPSDILVQVTFDGVAQPEQRIGDLYASSPALDGNEKLRALGTGWQISDQAEHVVTVTLRLPEKSGNESQSALIDINARVTPLPAETTPAETSPAETSPAETTPATSTPATSSPAGAGESSQPATPTSIPSASSSGPSSSTAGSDRLATTGFDLSPWFAGVGLLLAAGVCLLARARRSVKDR